LKTTSTRGSTRSTTPSSPPIGRRRTPTTPPSEELLQVVRTEGEVVEDDDLETSQFILPPADLSFVEAGVEFTGDGLIPDPA
jgi:hypothetical protein